MVDDVAEPDIRQRIHNLSDGHDNANRADCNPDFVGVEVLQLTHQVCHKAQTQLAGEVRKIVALAHYERRTVLINGGAVFFTECHIVFLLFFRESFPCFCIQYNICCFLYIALFDLIL